MSFQSAQLHMPFAYHLSHKEIMDHASSPHGNDWWGNMEYGFTHDYYYSRVTVHDGPPPASSVSSSPRLAATKFTFPSRTGLALSGSGSSPALRRAGSGSGSSVLFPLTPMAAVMPPSLSGLNHEELAKRTRHIHRASSLASSSSAPIMASTSTTTSSSSSAVEEYEADMSSEEPDLVRSHSVCSCELALETPPTPPLMHRTAPVSMSPSSFEADSMRMVSASNARKLKSHYPLRLSLDSIDEEEFEQLPPPASPFSDGQGIKTRVEVEPSTTVVNTTVPPLKRPGLPRRDTPTPFSTYSDSPLSSPSSSLSTRQLAPPSLSFTSSLRTTPAPARPTVHEEAISTSSSSSNASVARPTLTRRDTPHPDQGVLHRSSSSSPRASPLMLKKEITLAIDEDIDAEAEAEAGHEDTEGESTGLWWRSGERHWRSVVSENVWVLAA